MRPVEPPWTDALREVDVVVVGCGPVGALTANLLGARGVDTLVVERSTTPHGQSRAFSCDDEALRVYQQAGLLDRVRAEVSVPPLAEYVNRRGRVFARIALSEIDFGYGHPPLHFFDQPRLERALRAGLDRFDHVRLALGTELVTLDQDGDRVNLVLRDVATGREWTVRARYVLGCDGARSRTRAAAGIGLVGRSYAEPWLAVSGAAQPSAVRVEHTTFVCDWRRPAFVSPGAGGTYRVELMLRPGETEAELLRPESVAALVEPYVDPERFTVDRAVVYHFHRLVARRWRSGRVFLLGDAAHQMPPFLGQGLCSGLRDAANLSWKLALVLAGHADPALLDTYERERRPHTVAMLRTSVRLGRVFLTRDRRAAWLRDSLLRAVQTVPRVRRFVERFEFKPVPAYRRGLMAGGRRRGAVGTMFPQPSVLVPGEVGPVPLDRLLGDGFALLGRPESVDRLDRASAAADTDRPAADRPAADRAGADRPAADRAAAAAADDADADRAADAGRAGAGDRPGTDWPVAVRHVVVHPPGTRPSSLDRPRIGRTGERQSRRGGPVERVDVVDVDGVLGEWLRRHRADLVLLRPDRFVYAVATSAGIDRVGRDLGAALRPIRHARPGPGDAAGPEAVPSLS